MLLSMNATDQIEDGSCPSDEVNIFALSRNRELPENVVEKMLPYIEDACVTKDDFERIPQEGKSCHS